MINVTRHNSLFNPVDFQATRMVDVIGCGATGSRIAMGLAKLGLERVRLWDFDIVEEHNIANQVFGIADIGKPKVEALAAIIKRDTGHTFEVMACPATGKEPLKDVVFLLTDTMRSRKEIWESAIRYRPTVGLMVETRMGAEDGRVYAVNPGSPEQVAAYEKTLYADEDAAVSACGTRLTVGATADAIAGMAVWRLIEWFRHEQHGGDLPEFETIFTLRKSFVLSRAA